MSNEMRIIKFRGKDRKTNEWLYCNLYDKDNQGCTYICTTSRGSLDVIPDTVGQFTGLFDKNGKEIYEGDILLRVGRDCENDKIDKVEYIGSGFYFGILEPLSNSNDRMERIGNIHDNPELLKL